MQAEQIAKALGNAKRVGKGWLASCPLPGHGQGNGDKNPSLSISDGEDGKPLFKCHSGCDQHELFHAIRNYGLLPEIEKKDPLASIKPLSVNQSVLEHEWVYVDEYGDPLFVKQRFKTGTAKGKDYRQARINKDGSKSYSLGDCRIVPYRLPELLNAKTAGRAIYLVEGEKAADALVEIGAIATSAHNGSGSWPAEITQYFAGATVVMLPDNDLAGWKYARLVAAALIPVVKSLRIADLPLSKPTDDAWEWVHEYGGTRQDLAELAKQAQPITSQDDVTIPERLVAQPQSSVAEPFAESAEHVAEPKTQEPYKPFKIESWQSVKDEPVNWLVEGVIPEKSFVALYGPPASFKSFIAMDIAECIASGRDWLGNKINGTGPVLYIAGEGHGGIGARIAAIKQHHNTPDDAQVYVVRSQINLRSSVDDFLALISAIDELVKELGVDLRMIIIDTLARAFGGGNENSSDDMGAFIQATGKIQNRYRCSLMLLHHAGKDTTKGLRGHSSLLGAVDTQMEIMRFPETSKGVIFMSKQKDGEDGQRYGFEAITVDIDRSDLGLENGSSLVIEASEVGEMRSADAENKPEKGKAIGAKQKIAEKSLIVAIKTFGSIMDTPEGRKNAITLDQWKAEFTAMIGSDVSPKDLATYWGRAKDHVIKSGFGTIRNSSVWANRKDVTTGFEAEALLKAGKLAALVDE